MFKNWSNTVLVAYSALPKIVAELDFGIETRVKAGFQSVHLKNGVSTYQLLDEMAQLNEEKRKMVNLRYFVAEALNGLGEIPRQILIFRVVRKRTFQQIADDLGMPLRTVFRRFEQAEQSFAAELSRKGYTEEWLEREYGEDRYIAPIHRRFTEGKYFVARNS